MLSHGDGVGMNWPEALLRDRQRPTHERLGIGEPVPGLEQAREIVEVSRHFGMVRTKTRIIDRQRATIEQLGLGEAIRLLQKAREIVEVPRHLRIVRP